MLSPSGFRLIGFLLDKVFCPESKGGEVPDKNDEEYKAVHFEAEPMPLMRYSRHTFVIYSSI